MLEIKNLTKRFGGLVAINDLSFDVKKGEILGLIGPNGAGKTTVFNLITGFYPCDSGTIKFKGEKINGLKTHQICLKGINRTHQVPKPFSEMTILENVMVGAFSRSRSLEVARQEALEIVENLNLSAKKDYLASSITIADRKRLELARGLATKPALLLVDEVVAGLNPKETAEAIRLLQNIREGGLTLVIVEHVMKAIMSISDRIIVIHEGKKIAEGTPKEIAADKKVIDAYLGERFLL